MKVKNLEEDKVRKTVREGYAKISNQKSPCCCGGLDATCSSPSSSSEISKQIGYSVEELASVPENADLGLGCGNPVALASLREGETILDLGSGAGLDCFLAAKKVGEKGKVIGVDMTPEMLDKARENARENRFTNVEFRLGEIENLPIADNIVDVIISNCVINLSPNKERVFQEAFRVLRPGGRLIVSDIVLLRELPSVIRKSVEAYIGCLSGAEKKNRYLNMISNAGFCRVRIVEEKSFSLDCMAGDPTAKAVMKTIPMPYEKMEKLAKGILSVSVYGEKPIN